MLNGDLLTIQERKNLDRLFVIWQNFKKIIENLENEKSWLEYDECHIGYEVHEEQKKTIDKTIEMVLPEKQNAWFKYSHEWDRLSKKYQP